MDSLVNEHKSIVVSEEEFEGGKWIRKRLNDWREVKTQNEMEWMNDWIELKGSG